MRLAPAHGEPGVEIFVYGVSRRRLPGAPASRGVEGDRAAAPARSRARRCSPSSRRKRSPPAPSTTTSSRSPTSACCSRTSRPSPTRRRCSRRCERLVPGLRICRGAGGRRAAGRRDPLLSVQRPAGHAARRRDDADRRRPKRARRRRCGAGSSGMSPATARSAGSRSSTSASRWPMAAARPACGCASSPIPATVDPRFLVDDAKLDRIAEVDPPALARADPPSTICSSRR